MKDNTQTIKKQHFSMIKTVPNASGDSVYDFGNHLVDSGWFEKLQEQGREFFLEKIFDDYQKFCKKNRHAGCGVDDFGKRFKHFVNKIGLNCSSIRKKYFRADEEDDAKVDKKCVTIGNSMKAMKEVVSLTDEDYREAFREENCAVLFPAGEVPSEETETERFIRLRGRFDWSKIMDVDEKIDECVRTSRGGDPEFSVREHFRSAEAIEPTEEQKWHFKYCPLDEIKFAEDAQRPRFDGVKNRVVNRIANEFDYYKMMPLYATQYEFPDGKTIMICTDGFGRYMGAKLNGHIKSLPVLYRKTKDYSKVPSSYFISHDNSIVTKITKADDVTTALNNGEPWAVAMHDTAVENGLAWSPDAARGQNYMKFSNRDVTYLMWKCGDRKDYNDASTIQFIKKSIPAYSRIRAALNDGNEIHNWPKVINAIEREIVEMRRIQPRMPKNLHLLTLLQQRSAPFRCKGRPMLKQWGRDAKWNLHDALDDLFRVLALKTANMTAREWFEDSGNGQTYFDWLKDLCLKN